MSIDSYSALCWICELRQADSGEHKIKASLLKKYYRKDGDDGNTMLYGEGDKTNELHSHKSNILKFPKVICRICNGKLTQGHDKAYDRFNEYIVDKFDKLFDERTIDFKAIYGDNWSPEKINLYKYFSKHAGCKVTTSGMVHSVNALAAFINGVGSMRNLKIFFELNEGMREAYEAFKIFDIEAPYIENTPTIWFDDNQGCRYYAGKIVYQWISVVWIQGESIPSGCNFFKPIEPLYIKYFKDCDSIAACKNGIEAYQKILNSGMTSLEESREYYLNLLNNQSA